MRILIATFSIQQLDALLRFSAQFINRSNEPITVLLTGGWKRNAVLPSVSEVATAVHQIEGCEAIQIVVRAGPAAQQIAAVAQEKET
ncbi:MAG: hypothetical protein JW862_04640, partial [Anaerolineales bacterium]|nr:hypothetical protein [Anaerolineales bacterium]